MQQRSARITQWPRIDLPLLYHPAKVSIAPMRIAYNLADQHFERTQSIGIFNLSVQLLQHLARDGRYDLQVLGNSSLRPFLADVMDDITFHTFDQPVSGKLQRIQRLRPLLSTSPLPSPPLRFSPSFLLLLVRYLRMCRVHSLITVA